MREPKFSSFTKALLRMALAEDIGPGDVTADLLVSKQATGKAEIIAKEPGVFCGGPVLREIFRHLDPSARVFEHVREGAFFGRGERVLAVIGKVRAVLAGERTALNLLGRLSAIATKTRSYVQKVNKYGVSVLDTRKTTPLWRELEKYAVRTGGGKNHRLGLYDAVFVKENHRPYGDLKKLKKVADRFEIEVRNLKELREALRLRPHVILFDNFSPRRLKKAVRAARQANPRLILEASGGITLGNAASYAAAGVDRISAGDLTHSVRSLDFSLLLC